MKWPEKLVLGVLLALAAIFGWLVLDMAWDCHKNGGVLVRGVVTLGCVK